MSGRLEGKVALITGASRGIGASVARAYAAEGAAVALAHEPTPTMTTAAKNLAAELRGTGADAITVSLDLLDPWAPGQAAQEVRTQLGPISTLVANAAASGRSPFQEIALDQWDRIQAVNSRGTWLLAQAVREDLIATRGSLITLTSVMVRTGQPGALHYTASKAAILGMTRALAREFGPHHVRVNAVMPGAIRTEHEVQTAPDAEAVAAEILPHQALPRRGYASDLAGAFVFLASEESSFITGQSIAVDGGWIMH